MTPDSKVSDVEAREREAAFESWMNDQTLPEGDSDLYVAGWLARANQQPSAQWISEIDLQEWQASHERPALGFHPSARVFSAQDVQELLEGRRLISSAPAPVTETTTCETCRGTKRNWHEGKGDWAPCRVCTLPQSPDTMRKG